MKSKASIKARIRADIARTTYEYRKADEERMRLKMRMNALQDKREYLEMQHNMLIRGFNPWYKEMRETKENV